MDNIEEAGDFYSRASREARQKIANMDKIANPFLLTRLSRGATPVLHRQQLTVRNFYSRASREARPAFGDYTLRKDKFLLTRLSRGATYLRRPAVGI